MRHQITTFLILLLFSSPLLQAQKEATNWYFGYSGGITFRNGVPEPLGGSKMQAIEGCAAISDPRTGELMFYSDGITVWNGKHEAIGWNLKGGHSSTQSALFVPCPGDSNKYYLFTVGNLSYDSTLNEPGLWYSELHRINGRWRVGLNNVFLRDSTAEKLTGTIHCNGRDYWVCVHHWYKNEFYSYLITDKGVSRTPVISTVGKLYDPPLWGRVASGYAMGVMKISPNGKRLALVNGADETHSGHELHTFSFDNNAGVVADYLVISLPINAVVAYSCSFSPDSKLLYTYGYGSHHIYQVAVDNRQTPPEITIADLDYTGPFIAGVHRCFQLGLDGKLYMTGGAYGQGDSIVLVIDAIPHPNVQGTGCMFEPQVLTVMAPTFERSHSFPNYMDYIFNDSGENDARTCSPPQAMLEDRSLCEGECTTFQEISSIYPKQWSWIFEGGTPSFFEGQVPPQVCYEKAGTYVATLIVSNDYGSDTARSAVVVHPRPSAALSLDVVICHGDTTDLLASGGVRYRWTPSAGLSSDTAASPRAFPKETTTYSVEIRNEFGCTTSASVVVRVEKTLHAEAKDAEVCAGEGVQLHASGGAYYFWSPSEGLDKTDVADPVATPSKSMEYRVIVSNGPACVDTAYVHVVVHELPVADAGLDQQICSGGAAQLVATGGVAYRWSPAEGLDNAEKADPIARPSATTQYVVSVANEYGCESYDTVVVVVNNSAVVDAGADVSLCSGEEVHLQASGAGIVRWLWSPSAGLDAADVSNPVARPLQTTRYVVRGETAEGCVGFDSVDVVVHPLAVVDAGADVSLCSGDEVQLQATGTDIVRWLWTPGTGLSATDVSNPVAKPTTTTRYVVRGWNASGCETTDSVEVEVTPRQNVVFRVGNVVAKVGTTFEIPIEAEVDGGGAVSDFSATVLLRADAGILQVNGATGGALISRVDGVDIMMELQLTGVSLSTPRRVASIECRALLSRDTATDVSCSIESDAACVGIECRSGHVSVEGVCFTYDTKRFQRPELSVGPNPAVEEVVVRAEHLSGLASVQLYDAYGRQLWEKAGIGADGFVEEVISTEEYGAGLYLVVVQSPSSRLVQTVRIIK